jgi:hypothetical protein
MPDPIRDTILEIAGDRISPADVDALSREIAALVAQERRRCAALCRDRANTWRNTSLAHSSLPSARDEARARANEAQYLADLIDP